MEQSMSAAEDSTKALSILQTTSYDTKSQSRTENSEYSNYSGVVHYSFHSRVVPLLWNWLQMCNLQDEKFKELFLNNYFILKWNSIVSSSVHSVVCNKVSQLMQMNNVLFAVVVVERALASCRISINVHLHWTQTERHLLI